MQRIDVVQPRQQGSPAWIEWERLRLELLAARNLDGELLARVRGYLASTLTQPATASMLLMGARAALRLGEGGEARRLLAMVFGHVGIESLIADGLQYRSARHAVVEAYLAEGNGDAAYRTMLRFQQEFAPLRADEAEHFVAGLVGLERYADAANWLNQLDPKSSYAAILRLRAGLLAPDAALAQGRAALARSADSGALALIESVGRLQGNRSILVEVEELRLNLSETGDASSRRVGTPGALWRRYAEAAQQAGNQAHLLVGDDAAWLAHAARMLALQPPLGRAMLGQLALQAGNARVRDDARVQLVAALKEARLASVALQLFSEPGRFVADQFDARLRYDLGDIAAEIRRPETALVYWRGLGPPANVTVEQWQVRRLTAYAEAGQSSDAVLIASELFQDNRSVSPEGRRRLLELALESMGRGRLDIAQTLLAGLRSRSTDAERFAVLAALGRCHEAKGDSRLAAEAYLDAAASQVPGDADRESLRVREAAAVNLLRAGMRDDARGIYEWLVRNAKEASVRESAVRVLKTL